MAHTGRTGGPLRELAGLVALVAVALAAGLLLRTFVCETYYIPSASMEGTLNEGDVLLGEKVTLRLSDPEAGDIVTFINPEDASETLIKRVIATAGQTVELVDGRVLVDGEAVDEPYTSGLPSYPYDITYPYTVPEGCVWVMGDNRTNSIDSRCYGAIPVSSITSRALFVFWPVYDVRTL